MNPLRANRQTASALVVYTAIICLLGGVAHGQQRKLIPLEVGGEDDAAPAADANYRTHVLLNRRGMTQGVERTWPAVARAAPALLGSAAGAATSAVVPSPIGPAFYPDDLFLQSAMPNLVGAAQSHVIFVNCTPPGPSCWGDPATFLNDVGQSNFIHLVDQYTGLTADNRYTLGSGFTAKTTITPGGPKGAPTISIPQIQNLVHLAAQRTGGGLGHIYHVFLPQGVETCSDALGTRCYSPSNPPTFTICAYHATVSFADVGHILYTVEPFQNIPDCGIPANLPPPNSQLIDSTNSTLSHELFETITDPDLTTGLQGGFTFNTQGQEIGDLCRGNLFFVVPMNGNNYAVQLEYSNTFHACAAEP